MRRQANNIRGNHVLAGREVDVRLAGVESARPPILVSEESFHNNNTSRGEMQKGYPSPEASRSNSCCQRVSQLDTRLARDRMHHSQVAFVFRPT